MLLWCLIDQNSPGHPVCREAFAYLVGIGKHRLTRCRHSFQGTDMRTLGGQGGFSDEILRVTFQYSKTVWWESVFSAGTYCEVGSAAPLTTQDLLHRLPWSRLAWHRSWSICTGALLSLCQQRPLGAYFWESFKWMGYHLFNNLISRISWI